MRLSGLVEPLEQRIAPATFTVTSAADSGAGSLRDAINQANGTANGGGPDVINFNLGTGPFLIEPLSQLPDITEAVIIDGYSQSGATVNNLATGTNANIIVELSGKGISSTAVNGLVLAGGGGSVVRGLAIYGFGPGINDSGSGIVIKSNNNRVEGSFIGTDESGIGNFGNENKNAGVRVGDFLGSTPDYSGNIIGGLALADRNILTGNAFGVALNQQSSGTVILGNLIGLNKDGTTAYGNFQSGVADSGSLNTQVGDGSAAGRNYISGNLVAGIIQGEGTGIQIRGNYIGTNTTASTPVGNGGAGIVINYGGSGGLIEGNVISGNGAGGIHLGSPVFDGGAFGFNVRNNFIGTNSTGSQLGNLGPGVAFYTFASNNVIGGTAGGQGNVIAFNGGAGIEDHGGGSNNRFYANGIRQNAGGLGIDMTDFSTHLFGVTLNDSFDGDSVTNWPEIQTFNNTGAAVTLGGVLNAKANTAYRVEFFTMAPNQIDPSGHGEGAVYLGFRDITTNGTGAGTFNFSETVSVPGDSAFSATATPLNGGSTSEFGPTNGPSVSRTWTGAVDTNWFTPGNWTPAGVPTPLDNATVSTGNVDVPNSASVANFTLSGGTLSGVADLTVRGALTWSGGTFELNSLYLSNGASGTMGSATAGLNWSSGSLINYGGLTVQNLGVNFVEGVISNTGKDAVLTLNAGFNDTDGSATPVSVSNTGLILKQGSSPFGFEGGISVDNQGTIRVLAGTLSVGGITQSSDAFVALIELAGGAINSTGLISLSGGELVGSGNIIGDVSNIGGAVYPGGKNAPGTLNITGDFTNGSGGSLVVDFGGTTAGTDYDRLNVSGTATLGGSLEKRFLPTFAVQGTTAFTFIDAFAVSNTFLFQSGGPNLALQYTATQVKLNAQGYTVTSTADSGAGSLRQAIIDANAAAGLDLILFNIAGGGVKTIAPLSALPAVTDTIYLDGYSQPGSLRNTSSESDYNGLPLIEIQGINIPTATSVGLSLGGPGGHTVSGLILNEFQQSAIAITSGGNIVAGNWIGLRNNGIGGSGTGDGVSIQSGSLNTIGGMFAGDRNVISGNNVGLRVANTSTFTVLNNWFGLYAGNVSFSNPFTSNVSAGILIENASEGTIGGQGAANVVAATLSGPGIRVTNSNGIHILENRIGYNGNDSNPLLGQINGHGILVESGSFAIDIGGGSDRNRIVGATGDGIRVVDSPGVSILRNIIGATDTGGAGTYGNGGHGIHVIGDASTNITIGGVSFGDGNYITRNSAHGIYVENTTIQSDALIRGNSIWRNGLKGIQLTSPQGSIAAPVITNVSTSPDAANGGFNVDITGTFSGTPSTNYTIDLSSSYNSEGEGRVYLKNVNVTTSGSGSATFSFSFNANQANLGALPGAIGGTFTATASNLSTGSTSEFSAPVAPSPMTLVVTNTADSGPGSLRNAITIANQHPGRDQINFNIAGTGVQTIFITSNLPNIEDPVFINGYSQSGSTPNTNGVGILATNAVINVAIRGAAPVDRGFFVLSGDSEFRGLNIAGMSKTGQFLTGQAFQISNEGDTVVAGNFLGTDAAGNAFVPDSAGGVFFNWSTGNRIGGVQPADRNIIASETNGVDFFSQSNGGVVRGNIFGLGANGTTPLGNTHSAILINGSSKTTVSENVITNNGTGIRIGTNGTTFFDQTRGNVISQNRIYNNSGFASGLGIDLIDFSGDGVSANDVNDADAGPNGMLNFPVLTGVTGSSISGTYSGLANTTFTIELFTSATGDVSGYGEGAAFLGSTTVTTNGSGTGSFTYNGAIPVGQRYTATATSAEFGTSEFSQNIAASATYTWDAGAGADTDWFNPLNWTSDTVPGAADTAQLLSNFTVTLTGPVTIAKFVQDDGIVTGGGAMTITSEFDWTKGTQTGPSTLTIASGAVATLSGFSTKTLDRRFLVNEGTLVLADSGALQYVNGPSFTNSGIFEISGDADFVAGDGTGATFTNSGSLQKTGGTGETVIGGGVLTFSSPGGINVLSGTLSINANGALNNASLINIANGTTLAFTGGITTLDGNPTMSGDGTFSIASGGTFSVNSGTTFAPPSSLQFSLAGTLTGAGAVTLNSTLNWSGGIMSGTGQTTISPDGALVIAGTVDLNARTLAAEGQVSQMGNLRLLNNGTITNSGTWNIAGDFAINSSAGGGTVSNEPGGVFRKSAGSGTSSVAAPNTFTNSGSVEIEIGTLSFGGSYTQTSGFTRLNSGSLGGGITFLFSGGQLEGSGDIVGNVNNTGAIVSPAGNGNSGAISITGNYTQGEGGTFKAELGNLERDAINVTGTATLDGTVEFDFLSGYSLTFGDSFEIVSAGTRSGSFSTSVGSPLISLGYSSTGAFALRSALLFTWTGAATSSWFDGPNWDRGEAPTPGDSVLFGSSSTISIGSTPVTIAGFTQTAGTFTGTAQFTVTDSFTLSGGTHDGAGQTVINATASAVISGGTVARPFVNSGTTTLSANTAFNTFTQNGSSSVLEFSNASTTGAFSLNGGTFVGAGVHSAGSFQNFGAIIRPGNTGATGSLGLNGFEQFSGGTLEIEIEGTGAGQFDILDLTGPATLGGGLSIDTVAPFIPVNGNTFRVITTPSTPSGNFSTFTGDVARLIKTTDSSGVLLTASTLTFVWDNEAGDGDWFNPINWDLNSGVPGSSDTAVLNIAANIVLNTPTTVSALTLSDGSLLGTGSLTVVDGFTWSGGTIGASITTGAGSTNSIGGTLATLNASLMTLGGTTTLLGTVDMSTAVGAEIRNTGSLTLTGTAGIGGAGLFRNAAGSMGVIVSGFGVIAIGVEFAGEAPFLVTSGAIDFAGGSNWAIGVAPEIASGSSIRFGAGTHNFLGSNSFTGSGTTRQTDGTMNFQGSNFTVPVGHTFIQDGIIGGAAELVVNGTFNWNSGTQSGTSTTRVSSGAVFSTAGSSGKTLDQRTLLVDAGGVFRVLGDGAITLQDDASIEVAGELNLQGPAAFSNGGGALSLITILSSGSFIKTGADVNMIDVPFTNAGAASLMDGAVNFQATFEQTAGYTSLAGGGIGFANPAQFSGGVLKGSGTISGTINNTGALVSPGASPGQFVINGDYIQGPGGSLFVEIQGVVPGSQYDQIQVIGNASLDGEIEVVVSGIAPARGDIFSVLTAGSVSGTFGSVSVPAPLESRTTVNAFQVLVPVLPQGLVDLASFTGRNGAFIPGLAGGDLTGISVAGLGSINGDSFGDFAIGASGANGGGATYIVFGKFGSFGTDFDLSLLDGTEGFKISGGENSDSSGFSVSSPGDINGDGIRDILIGDPLFDGSGENTGAAFIVYGRSTVYPAVIDLSTLDGTDGFRMDLDGTGVFAGTSVAGAGDVNGDGVNDMIIGVPDSNTVAADAGAAFVVFGRPSSATPFPAALALSSLSGTDGFAITGSFVGDRFGTSVAAAGDINDDGLGDIVIGAPTFDGAAGSDSGAVYVVFGKSSGFTATLDAGALNGKNGFRIEGRAGAERLGIGVSTAGDMNGDGIDDLLIAGRFSFQPVTDENVGVAYVIFGKKRGYTSTLDLAVLNGANGFRVFTEAKSAPAIISVSSVGDFNADGFNDIAIGSPGTGDAEGMTYLMFGRRGGFATDLSLSTLNATTGFRFRGEVSFDESGTSVSGTDVNGDGRADLIIGAPRPGDEGVTAGNGGAYVIYGIATQEIPDVVASGTSITFDDVDGDIITIKSTNGRVTADMLIFGPGGVLQMVDLTATNTLKDGANITFSVKQNGGNGVLNVGAIHADGLRLGKITVTGDLGQIDVGNDDPLKPALKQLIVGSIGEMGGSTQQTGTEEPLVSEIRGALPKVIVRGNFTNATFNVLGKLGNITINGNFTGTGAFDSSQAAGLAALGHNQIGNVAGGTTLASSGLSAGSIGNLNIKGAVQNAAVKSNGGINNATVGSVSRGAIVAAGPMRIVKVLGELVGDATTPSVISALPKGTAATAINKMTVRGNVSFAEILIGYDTSFAAVNGDAGIGSVVVNGNWTASSLVAGIKDDTADGFGQHDIAISGFEGTTKVFSKIASLIIKGTVAGTAEDDDIYAITAQKIGKATIAGVKYVFDKVLPDNLLVVGTNDFRLVEVI